MKTKIIYAFLLFLSIGIASNGQINQYITFSTNYTVNNVLLNDSNNYSRITMPGMQKTDSIGYPALPVKYIRLVIPQNCDANIIIINNITKQDIHIINKIEPVQPPIPTSMNYQSNGFNSPNSKRYSSQIPYPVNIVRIVHQDYYRGHRIVTIAVYPFQYIPADNKLDFISSVDFTLQYSPNTISQKKQLADSTTLKILSSMVENKDDIKTFLIKNKPPNGIKTGIHVNCDYIIVTSQDLAPAFAQFMAWKRRKGVNIKLVTTEDIYANYTGDNISGINDDAGKIRQFLFDTYNNSDNLQYALLGGYYTIVPIRLGYSNNNNDATSYVIPADLYFADFDGDWEVDNDGRYGEPQDNVDFDPEIYVGRIGAQTTHEIENWTRKTLLYEQNPGNGDNSYVTHAFFTQSDDMQSTDDADNVLNECNWVTSNTVFNEDDDINGYCTSYVPDFPTGQDVINEFNNHYGFCSFMGHGCADAVSVATLYLNTDRYCDGTLYNGNTSQTKHNVSSFDFHDGSSYAIVESGNGMDNMTNTNYPSIMYSMSCETAQSDYYPELTGDRSMAEAYTVVVNGGGSHYLGNTRYGWTGTSTYMFIDFCRAISNYTIYKIGITEAYSKVNYSYYMEYTHNLFGCPETEIWTTTPSQFSSASVTENGSSVTVSSGGVSGCTMCVMSALDNGNSYYNVQTNVSSYTFTNVPQPYLVTITKHDYIPYLKNPDNIYIQDEIIGSDLYIYGVNFYAGENVTNQLPQGPVVINNNSNVVFDASGNVNLEGGFEVQSGSSFEIK